MLSVLLTEAATNSRDLYQFDPFHKNIRGPGTDFTKFGETWFDILIVQETSAVLGKHNMQKIVDYVRQGHNVVLLANHQVRREREIKRLLQIRIYIYVCVCVRARASLTHLSCQPHRPKPYKN